MTISMFGTPFGSGPFGFGTPVNAAPIPVDPSTGARFLSVIDRDYALGADGDYQRMPEVRQRVVLALLSGLGPLPRRIDDTALPRMTDAVNRNLAVLISEGVIRVDDVSMESPKTGMLVPTVSFTVLATGESDDVELFR